MPLKKRRTTSSHHFLRGKVQFDPSVYFQCWDIAGNYSLCKPANWGLLAKKLLEYGESSKVTFSKPTEENILGADSPFTPFYFCHQQVTILKKHHAWIALLEAHLIGHLDS